MPVVALNMYQALAVAAVMLVIGQVLVNRIAFLRKYCIPAPVVGGLIFAVAHTVLRGMGVVEFEMDTTLQTVFMTAFFCSVGFLAAFSMLKKGGIGVIKFLILAVLMVVIQDLVGGFGAKLFGLDGRLGLAMGSIPLVGGHGTSASFGAFLEERGVEGATTVAVACATYGLIAGCMIGGPIASAKIRKYDLRSDGIGVSGTPAPETAEVPKDSDSGDHHILRERLVIPSRKRYPKGKTRLADSTKALRQASCRRKPVRCLPLLRSIFHKAPRTFPIHAI